MAFMAAIPLRQEIYYPESDGQPMGETDAHRKEMTDLIEALDDHFRNDPQVYVAGNLFLYYELGDPRGVICPDVFLVRGVTKGLRRTYKLWEEGRVPSLVIEVTSRDTRSEDISDGSKKGCYERLGVEEYFLHDPYGEYLKPRLQGFRLVEGRYRPIEPAPDGSLISQTTGLIFRLEDIWLRLVDAETGERLLTPQEAMEEVRRERAARLALEEELARLRREQS
jgi:Uma2 family endonuclease